MTSCSHCGADEIGAGSLPVCKLTPSSSFLFTPAAVFISAGCAVRGGGTWPEAAGTPGCRREEEPAAEGAGAQGEAIPEERPQSCAQGRAGGAGAAAQAESRGEESGPSPQHHNTGGASTRGAHERGHTSGDATLNRITATHLD